MSFSKSFTKKVEARTDQIYDDWIQFRQLSGEQYREKGRGAFLVDLTKPFDRKSPTRYASIEETKKYFSDSLSIIMRLGEYNPEREIVIAFLEPSSNEGQCIILNDREDESGLPPIVDDFPDPSVAKSFDELTDILNDIWSRRDVDGLSGPARGIWRVLEAKWQIASDGFGGYLWNVGTVSFEAHCILKEADASQFVEIFDNVFSKFPEGKPSNDEDKFSDQLEKIEEQEDDPWDKEDRNFYAIEEGLEKILWKYWEASNRKPQSRT